MHLCVAVVLSCLWYLNNEMLCFHLNYNTHIVHSIGLSSAWKKSKVIYKFYIHTVNLKWLGLIWGFHWQFRLRKVKLKKVNYPSIIRPCRLIIFQWSFKFCFTWPFESKLWTCNAFGYLVFCESESAKLTRFSSNLDLL